MEPTGVEEIEGLVQDVGLVDLGVSTIDNKGIANQQTGMAYPRSGPLGGSSQWVAGQVAASLDHPQVALDGSAVDQTTHDVDVALLRGCRIDGGAIAGKRARVRRGVCQPALSPGVEVRVGARHLYLGRRLYCSVTELSRCERQCRGWVIQLRGFFAPTARRAKDKRGGAGLLALANLPAGH